MANLCFSIKFVLCNLNLKSIPTVRLVRKDSFNNRIIQRKLKPELTRAGGRAPTCRSMAVMWELLRAAPHLPKAQFLDGESV